MVCPICKSNKGGHVFKLCDNMKILGKSFPQEAAYVAVCEACGLVYTDTKATQEDFLSYYKNGAVAPNYYDMFGKKDTDDYYAHLVSLLAKHIEKEDRILDVAGAWGEFAGYLKENGYQHVVNLDANEKCAEASREKGVETICVSSADMGSHIEQSVDVVILNHTLEHILDVEETFNGIDAVLREEGILFIEVPDVTGYINEDAAPFNFLTYEHVLHLSQNDLRNLAALYGYTIIEEGSYYKKVSNYPSVYAVMKKTNQRGDIISQDLSERRICAYIKKSQHDIAEFIEPLKQSGEPLILWGIGASTAILLEAFADCNVIKLIDSNHDRQGLSFFVGKELVIEPPEQAGEGTIVILSIPYYKSITRQLRQMGLTNKIVSLARE